MTIIILSCRVLVEATERIGATETEVLEEVNCEHQLKASRTRMLRSLFRINRQANEVRFSRAS